MVKNLRLLFFWRHYLLRLLAHNMLAGRDAKHP